MVPIITSITELLSIVAILDEHLPAMPELTRGVKVTPNG